MAAFRSLIETKFAHLSHVFKRFQAGSYIRTSSIKTYNLQFKLACLLLNIKIFCENNEIETSYLHKMWNQPEFDFPDGRTPIAVLDHELPKHTKENKKAIVNAQQNLIRQIIKEDLVMNPDEEVVGEEEFDNEKVSNSLIKRKKCQPCSVVVKPV